MAAAVDALRAAVSTAARRQRGAEGGAHLGPLPWPAKPRGSSSLSVAAVAGSGGEAAATVHPPRCANCTWQGSDAALRTSLPAARVRALEADVAAARRRIEEKLLLLEGLRRAAAADDLDAAAAVATTAATTTAPANASSLGGSVVAKEEAVAAADVARAKLAVAARRRSPLDQLTVENYRTFFANASNARYLFGADSGVGAGDGGGSGEQPQGTPSASVSSFLETREMPFQNLWNFRGAPGKRPCETACMQAWVKMRASCVKCLDGFHQCTQANVLEAVSSTTFYSSLHDVCQNVPTKPASKMREWPVLKDGCCSFDFEACPAPLCLVEAHS